MVIVGPAVGFGALLVLGVVFLAGYLAAYGVLEAIAKRSTRKLSKWRYYLTEGNLFKFAISGGIISVVVAILLFLNIPREASSVVWPTLTALGILFGLFTFIISGLAAKAEPRAKDGPPASVKAPRASWNVHRPPAIKPPSAPDNFYRDLLARTRYDKDLADRLIEYERKRAPFASLDDLCRSAIARWERDNR